MDATQHSANPAELLMAAFVGFLSMVAIGGVVIHFFERTTNQGNLILSAAIAPAGALAITLLLLRAMSRRSFESIGLSKSHLRQSGKASLASAVIILPVTFLAMLGFSFLYDRLGIQTEKEHPLLRALGQSRDLIPLVVISAIILAPLLEELAFRGCIQSAVAIMLRGKPVAGRWLAIVITSSIFVLVHGEWWMMPPLMVLSIGLGYAYARTENLWVAVFTHAAFNATSLVLFSLK
jgi:membrane protease YdiL (CAAX protease family)